MARKHWKRVRSSPELGMAINSMRIHAAALNSGHVPKSLATSKGLSFSEETVARMCLIVSRTLAYISAQRKAKTFFEKRNTRVS